MRVAKCLLKLFVIHIILFIFSLNSYALEKPTHKVINEYIAENTINEFSFDQYIKKQLGFQEGWKKFFNNKMVSQWLGYGGRAEDEPYLLRSLRHFHNPLEIWDEAGLWGTFESSVIWGQRTDQWPGGNYSWHDVRDYFYTALTSEEPATRENYFAETFRGLGQLMHLVEDASVPLHTRNDAHVRFNYEKWVDKFQRNKYKSGDDFIFNTWLSNEDRYGYDKSLLGYRLDLLPENASISVARIVDTDKYIGNNPEITKNEAVGIAEYSNANFLSNGTIPGTIFDGDFPYPSIPDLPSSDWDIVDPRDTSATVKRSYFMTGNDTDVDGRYRLATKPMFEFVFYENLDEGFLAILPTSLDPNVYRDYAERLIPRAVGYSAGLLDYFFRGAIEIALPDNGVYALTDLDPDVIDPSQQGFDRIQLLAQNTAPEGEEMTGGTVTLVVIYKVGEGDQFQNPPADTSDEFHYIVKELGGTHSIPRDTPALFEFDISASQIPLWATDVSINLVYKGNLGSEEGAIAVGFKDISEPTPINYYNVMDKICMTTSTGVQLFDSGSAEAIAHVDVDENGVADYDEWDVYPHNAENVHIRFSPVDRPQAATSASSADNNYQKAILVPSEYFRLFILSDYRFNRSASVEVVKIADDDQCDQFHGIFSRPPRAMDAIKNQTDLLDPVYCGGYEPCYARLIPGFHTTRGVVSFFSVIFDNASYPIDSICSYED